MAWTSPIRKEPQDRITASEMNTYIRDNQLETLAGGTPIAHGIAVTNGPNDVLYRGVRYDARTTLATTTSTSPVDVGPSTNLANIEHSGTLLVMLTAELANSSTALTSYSIGTVGGLYMSTSRAARNATNNQTTCSAHCVLTNVASPVSLTGWLWTSNGATTATLRSSQITVIPL